MLFPGRPFTKVDLERVPMIGEQVEEGVIDYGGDIYIVTNVITHTHDGEIAVILDRPRH